MSNLYQTSKTSKTLKKQFIENVVQTLLKLDQELSPAPSTPKLPTLTKKTNKNFSEMYSDLILKFLELGELEQSVIVHAVALAKKVVKIAKKNYEFKKGEFVLLFAACLYLSIKVLVDEERWFVSDFAYVSGLEEAHIEKMEIFVAVELLEFDYKISEEEFWKEEEALVCRGRRRPRFLSK
jgi:hypothetical protein